jgi:hypothetical protein
MRKTDEDKLIRLLEEAKPRTLAPDPQLPVRVRSLARENAKPREDAWLQGIRDLRRGWVRLSLAAAAAVAILIGGYLGYSAGTSVAAGNVDTAGDADVAGSDIATEGVDAFWSSWSQAGFAEDWRDWDASSAEVEK